MRKEKPKRGQFALFSDLHPAFPSAKYGNKNPQRVSPSSLDCTMQSSQKMVLQGCKRRAEKKDLKEVTITKITGNRQHSPQQLVSVLTN